MKKKPYYNFFEAWFGKELKRLYKNLKTEDIKFTKNPQ